MPLRRYTWLPVSMMNFIFLHRADSAGISPYTVCRPVVERIERKVPVQVCKMVTEEHVRQVPVKTCKMVYENRVEQVPYRVCRTEAYQETISVPRRVEKRTPITYTTYVPRVVCYRVPIDACGVPITSYEVPSGTSTSQTTTEKAGEPTPAKRDSGTDAADVPPTLPPGATQP